MKEIQETGKDLDKKAVLLFILTIGIGTFSSLLPFFFRSFLPHGKHIRTIAEMLWDVSLGGLAGYLLLGRNYLEQFRKFSWKIVPIGFLLLLATGVISGAVYSELFGPSSENSMKDIITLKKVIVEVPFILMGEEVLTLNIVKVLERKGISFRWASLLASVLFALWHIPVYGFRIVQLVVTLVPVRMLLNWLWKRSGSIWVSWICHYLYDCVAFLKYL